MLLSPRILVAFPACLVLAAHFLRVGALAAMVLYLAVPWTLMSGRLWALHLNRALLWLGVGVWLYAAAGFVDQRFEQRKPFVRLALIMTTVTALTAGAARMLGSDEAHRGFS